MLHISKYKGAFIKLYILTNGEIYFEMYLERKI